MRDLSVLVIDDDAADRQLVRRLIASSGVAAKVHEAGNGEEAHALEAPDVDAVFLDYMLPGTDGLVLLQELLERWPRGAVILMTGQGDQDLAKSAIQRGATDYITKQSLNANAIGRMLETGIKTARMRWKLEQQRAELATFAETLVHDLKAPIRSVGFLARQIEEDLDDGDLDAIRAALRLMGKSTSRMRDLIDSLAGHVRLDREEAAETVPVADLVDRALIALSREIEDRGAVVGFAPSAAMLTCHPPQIAQLLQNLVANALKYAGSRVPRIDIAVGEAADHLHFRVSDNGVGIAAEHTGRIFEPFKRAAAADAPPGTGLGLATCRKIVQRHGGTIWCQSEPGVGTTIHFRIPRGQDGAWTGTGQERVA